MGDGFGRGLRLWVAGTRAHPVVATGGSGVDYSGGGDDECGGRSSDELGDEAMVAVGLRAWLPRHLHVTASMWVSSVRGYGDHGHGDEELRQRRDSVSVDTMAAARS